MQSEVNRKCIDKPQKSVFITDLDHSDVDHVDLMANVHRKAHKKRTSDKKPKVLQTMTGNFNRSRSAECKIRQTENEKLRPSKIHNYLNDMLQTKEMEMEKMIQRIVTLQQFNEQFSEENLKLHKHMQQLELKIEQLQKQVNACDGCKNLSEELTAITMRNKKINSDIGMMKTLVYRLNVQIEYYQDKQRHREQEALHDQGGGDIDLNEAATNSRVEPWQFSAPLYTKTLGPLLKSYDEMIHDKEELFQQYKKEFEHFSGELKRVLEENNTLVQQHEQLKRDVSGWREERTRFNAALNVCRIKAEAHAEKADLAKEKLVEVVQAYEARLQSLGLEMEHMQSAYARCKSDLIHMKSVSALPKDTIASSLQECKDLLERLKSEHNDEKSKMQHKIEELNKQLLISEGEFKTLSQENITLKRDLAQQQNSCEELKLRNEQLVSKLDQAMRSRAALKARLNVALQWAQKLEKSQSEIHGTWDALKRLETIVKHKEAQVRGLHARHLEEIDKLQDKLKMKEDTIRNILKSKVTPRVTTKDLQGDSG